VPKTVLGRHNGDLQRLRDLQAPLCIKPNNRSPAYDDTFSKAYRIEIHEEAHLLCKQVLDTVGEVIVQEWIEGPNDSICFCLCMSLTPKFGPRRKPVNLGSLPRRALGSATIHPKLPPLACSKGASLEDCVYPRLRHDGAA
jgi:hypothetical protein